MNKKLLILPVISALLLAGCTMGRTTKKKKKSSSVDVTSQSVAPTPTSGTPAPAPTSATPAPTPTSASPAPTSQTPTPTPTSSSSVIPPVTGWSSEELNVFNTNFGGIVPPYVEGGLDLENSELDKGVAYSHDMTETQANAYLASLDSSWEFVQDQEQGDYYAKDTADGNAYVLIYSSYYEDDTSTFYIVYQYGEYEGGGGGGDEPTGSWTQVTTTPAAGTDYIIGLNNGTSDVFLDGAMQSTYYPSCQATTDTAIRFTVALSGEGFTIQATSGSVNGKYLGITISGTHVNAVYGDSAYVWKWVDTDTYQGSTVEAHTFGAYEDGGYGSQWYILAQQSGKTTVSPTYNKWWSSNFIARLYQQAA